MKTSNGELILFVRHYARSGLARISEACVARGVFPLDEYNGSVIDERPNGGKRGPRSIGPLQEVINPCYVSELAWGYSDFWGWLICGEVVYSFLTIKVERNGNMRRDVTCHPLVL